MTCPPTEGTWLKCRAGGTLGVRTQLRVCQVGRVATTPTLGLDPTSAMRRLTLALSAGKGSRRGGMRGWHPWVISLEPWLCWATVLE